MNFCTQLYIVSHLIFFDPIFFLLQIALNANIFEQLIAPFSSLRLETATTKSLADSFDGLSPPGASTSSVSKPEPQSSSHKSSPFLQQYKDDTNNIASPPQHVSEIRKASPLPSTHTDYNEQPAEHEVPEDNAGQAAEVEQGGPPEETSLVNGHGNEDDDDDDFDLDDLPDPVAAI